MTVSSPDRAVPFGDFLEVLRRQGFPIGLDHHVRLQSLLAVVASDCEPDRLKTLLCPIFATSRDQQEHFYRAFEQFYPLFVPPGPGLVHRGSDAGDLMPPAPKRAARRIGALVLGGLLAAALVIGVLWQARSSRSADTLATDSAAPPVVAPAPPVAVPVQTPEPPRTPESFGRRHAALLQLLAVCLPLLAFAANEWRLYRRRRLVIQRERREKPPFVWPIRMVPPANPFSDSAELQFAARLLRERERGESARLAVEESVTATIEAMGFPTLRFRTDTRPPDYLVLIERTAFRDHGARLFNDLGRALEREGVHVTRYYYDRDPRICQPESGGDSMLLVDLRRRYPTYRLLVFGGGEALIDPITGRLRPWTSEFLSWSERALLTPEAPRAWGQREVTLAGHFIVLPATVQGLLALVEHFRTPIRPNLRAWRDRSTDPVPPAATLAEIRDLKRYLGDQGYKWLTACAVYPELHWDLTLHLGQLAAMPPGLITERHLLRLLRLPWFRAGSLPDDLRSALMADLDPATERAVRTAIVELLESDPAPGDSVAANQYDLELVVQRLALSRDDRKRRRDLLRRVATLPRKVVMQDLAILQLLERVPSSRLAMMLPRRLRMIFFKDGLPALGTRFVARGALTVALILTALAIVTPSGAANGVREDSPLADTLAPDTLETVPTPAPAIARAPDTVTAPAPSAVTVASPDTATRPAIIAGIRVFPESVSLVAGVGRPVTVIARAYDSSGTFIPSAAFTFSAGGSATIRLSPDGTVSPTDDTGRAVLTVTSGELSVQVPVTIRSGRPAIVADDSASPVAAAPAEVQPPRPATPVLDAAALEAIGARIDAAVAALSAGRTSDPMLHLTYPGSDAASRQKARDRFSAFFRDFDFVGRNAKRDPPRSAESRVEVDFQIPYEWHDSFGRQVKRSASFRAHLTSDGDGGWNLNEVQLLRPFP